MRPLGIKLHAIGGLSDEEYIREVASLGYQNIFTLGIEKAHQSEIANLCAKYGMTYETVHAPFRGINAIWLDDDLGMLARLCDAVDCAVAAGVGIVVLHLSSGESAPSITDIGRARFARLADYAYKSNVKLAFENQRKLANLAWAMETFPPEVAGFCWDCGHESCFTPHRQYMPLFGDRLLCTHIHDNFGRYNEDAHMIPFEGTVNFNYVTRAIRESGFQGSLMLEFGHGKSYADIPPRKVLARAYDAAVRLREMTDGV